MDPDLLITPQAASATTCTLRWAGGVLRGNGWPWVGRRAQCRTRAQPAGIMGPVSSRPSSRGHLRAVPDSEPARSTRSRTPEPGLFDLPEREPDPAPPPTGERAPPDNVTAADIQAAVAEFGDDTPALTAWLPRSARSVLRTKCWTR